MNVSDLAKGGAERRAAADELVQTEETNAVNADLVGNADKSSSMIKDELFKRHTREFSSSSSSASRKSADAVNTSESESGTTATLLSDSKVENAAAVKAVRDMRKAVTYRAVSKTLEDTEFEGVDDAYYKSKTSYKLSKKGLNKLRARSAEKATSREVDKGLGALSEKRYRKPKGQEELQRELQRKRNQYTSRALQAEKAAQASSTKAAGSKSIAVIASKGGSGAAAAGAGVGGGMVALIIGAVLALIFLAAIIGGILDDNDDVGSLTGDEAIIAEYLLDQGFSKAAVAGILGNIANEGNPNSDSNMDGMFNYRYERACGMFQYTHASNTTPPYYTHNCEYCRYKRWCSENGKSWSDIQSQLEWTFGGASGNGGWESRWIMRKTYYVSYWSGTYSWLNSSTLCTASEYKNLDDPAIAAYCWMAGYEGPATGAASHLDRRVASAQQYFEKLNSGGGSGQTYASSSGTARAIADACYRTPSTASGYCAMWVSRAYQNATGTYIGGNANDMYFTYCVSSDRSELKVGMIVASGPHSGHTGRYRSGSGGTTSYGHVGIYVGDNKVMHSTGGSVHTDSLDDWIASYTVKDTSCGQVMTVKWGYPNWV